MKKITALLLASVLTLGLTACGGGKSASSEETAPLQEEAAVPSGDEEAAPETEETENKEEEAASAEETASAENQEDSAAPAKDVLVVYFSATGNTKAVAEKIAAITDADIYEIKAAVEYTEADLDWNDSDSRTTHEQDDPSVRPEIGSDSVSVEGYSTIYIGYPIWWGEEPRIMDTFVESLSFDGIRMIPFCTSGSSGMGRSGKNLAENAGSGEWQDGKRFGAGASEDEIRSWIDSMK